MEDVMRELIVKGDRIIFNVDLLNKIDNQMFFSLGFNRIRKDNFPQKGEIFVVKKTDVRKIYKDGKHSGYQHLIAPYSEEKGAFTSVKFPSKYIQWIIQYENGIPNKKIFVSEVFNSGLFEATLDGPWNWILYGTTIK